jgi:hypothetical protein
MFVFCIDDNAEHGTWSFILSKVFYKFFSIFIFLGTQYNFLTVKITATCVVQFRYGQSW